MPPLIETKICSKCKRELPMTSQYYYKSYGNFRPECKECHNGGNFIDRKVSKIIGMKICSKCGKELPNECFHNSMVSSDNLHAWCKKCTAENGNENRKKNSEHYANHEKQYRKEHKEDIAKTKHKYYIDNIEHISKRSKKHRDKIKPITAERGRLYHKTHMEQHRLRYQRYRAIKKQLPHTLTIKQWEQIKLDFNNKCAYCGKELPLAQEHFIALSSGGEYSSNNIIPSCQSCNSSKGNRDFFTWYPKYKYYSKKREKFILEKLNYKNNIQQLTLAL